MFRKSKIPRNALHFWNQKFQRNFFVSEAQKLLCNFLCFGFVSLLNLKGVKRFKRCVCLAICMDMVSDIGNRNRRKTLILFDVGSVLLKLDFNRFYKEASKLSENLSSEDFRKAYLHSHLEGIFLSGGINTTDCLDKLSEIISSGKEIPHSKLIKIVSYMWKEPVEEMIELKRRVYKAGYSVGIFSNMSELGLKVISEMEPKIFETYDSSFPSIFSFKVGSIKPHPAMYQEIKGYDKVILIDDNESYIRMGIDTFEWYGILFTPFIDEAEASRPAGKSVVIPSENLRIVNSVDEVVEPLKYFGVDV